MYFKSHLKAEMHYSLEEKKQPYVILKAYLK